MKQNHHLIILLLPVMLACNGTSQQAEIPVAQPATEQAQATLPEVASVDAVSAATAMGNEATFNGIIVLPPQRHATVTISMDGIVKATSLLSGKYVGKGDLLVTLENPAFIDLQQSYLDAYAQCEFLEAEYRRQEILSKEEAASQKKFQQSKADYLSMKSRVEAASARLAMLGIAPATLLSQGILPLLEVRAPISGYISNLQINIGKYTSAGEAMCEIIDKSDALVKLTAYEKDLGQLQTGEQIQFRVNSLDTATFEGEIISIGQQVDNVNRSLEVYARVKESNALFRPGMYVNARIVRK